MQATSTQPNKKITSTGKKSRILIIGPEMVPETIQQAAQLLNIEKITCQMDQALDTAQKAQKIAAAVLILNNLDISDCPRVLDLTHILESQPLCTLVIADESNEDIDVQNILQHLNPERFTVVTQPESPQVTAARLATLMQIQPTIKKLSEEVDRLRMVSQPLNNYFSQVNEEMQLASRLQRDFLPREMPKIPGIKFANIFRPATWVSGDIYDVMRLDENHIGFYIADAVGHGMPAALLTMFIKRAIVTKRIEGNTYTLIEPGETLKQLNADMVGQNLSNFQFATCCYGLLNTKTLRLRLASAGHPPPMIINKAGQNSEIDVGGSLLGVFPDQTYTTEIVQLHLGDKLLLYSDGVEVAFVNPGPDQPLRFRQEFDDLGYLDIKDMCDQLLHIINREEGSLHPRDDVTIVGLQIESKPEPEN